MISHITNYFVTIYFYEQIILGDDNQNGFGSRKRKISSRLAPNFLHPLARRVHHRDGLLDDDAIYLTFYCRIRKLYAFSAQHLLRTSIWGDLH